MCQLVRMEGNDTAQKAHCAVYQQIQKSFAGWPAGCKDEKTERQDDRKTKIQKDEKTERRNDRKTK